MGSSESTARRTAAGSVEVRARRVDGTSVGFRAVLVAIGDGRLVVADSTPVPAGWRFTGAGDELLEVRLPARPELRDVSVVYTTTLDNLDHVVVPDTGRWHMNSSHPISAWRFSGDLQVRANSLKTPVYVFERLGGGVHGVGVIAAPAEMDITLHEPASNRALNVHFRRLRVEFTLLHLADTAEAGDDGEAAHRFWIAVLPASQHADWRSVLRRFSACERLALDVRYSTRPEALQPYWCTWVDWSSEHVTQELVLRNARLAAELGISNIVIDDGWFGRGLDSSHDVPMDIGDWTPDPVKYPDLPWLIESIHALGSRVIIWCAPHAVGPASAAFGRVGDLLVQDALGAPILNPTMFYSLCFRSERARRVMVDVVRGLFRRHPFDGVTYDLFDGLPSEECESPEHAHDLGSTIVGLHRVLAECAAITEAQPRPVIVEMKQDYATAAIAGLGSVVRGGDSPYASRTNLVRMDYIQARGMPGLNDYQTFPRSASPAEVCVIALRMVAGGVPAWGRDLTALDPGQRVCLLRVHRWYRALLHHGAGAHRESDRDGVLLLRTDVGVVLICTEPGRVVTVPADCCQIVNATLSTELVLRSEQKRTVLGTRSILAEVCVPRLRSLPSGVHRLDLGTGSVLTLAVELRPHPTDADGGTR